MDAQKGEESIRAVRKCICSIPLREGFCAGQWETLVNSLRGKPVHRLARIACLDRLFATVSDHRRMLLLREISLRGLSGQ